MLTHTFCHLQGIGPAKEKQLWDKGITTWEKALTGPDNLLQKNKGHSALISESIERLSQGDATFFASRLPSSQQYRLFESFRKNAVFLDIETTGLSPWDTITTIALYDGNQIRYYIQGQNLEQFSKDIQDYGLIITFNGKTFDLPFLRARLNIPLDHAHIDLRYVLAGLGFKGGLKKCEKAMGLDRGDLDGVDGSFAVLLWHEYEKTGNENALETLLAYNIEDVINLETLMVRAFNMNTQEISFTASIPEPEVMKNPLSPDMTLVDRLKSRITAFW
ncbi:MAG: ribonuclease H-like domain-containing protein [Desulfobacterales bacterium]|nr:ribonuclease H-like domain-containing protein [Desulfobacterales bacterium]